MKYTLFVTLLISFFVINAAADARPIKPPPYPHPRPVPPSYPHPRPVPPPHPHPGPYPRPYPHPIPPPRPHFSCTAEMVAARGNGPVIDRFTAHSGRAQQEACMMAMNQCHNELLYRQSHGQNIFAVCMTERYNGGITTQYCSYKLMERTHYDSWEVDRITRSAVGPASQSDWLHQQACQSAEYDCQMMIRYGQFCVREVNNHW